MKSTWFSNRQRYDFARLIQEADYGKHHWDLFRSFLAIAVGSLRQAAHVQATGAMCETMEAAIIEEQGRLAKPERITEAFSVLALGLEDERADFLGSTMMELGIGDVAYKGQCFTPAALCKLMAQVTLGDVSPIAGRTLTLQEPACGGGAMLIAATEVLQDRGFFPWHYHWTAIDVDWRCFAMTYIQTTLLGIPAVVVHGNTLSLEVWDQARTIASIWHPPKRRYEADDNDLPQAATVPAIARKTGQLELFAEFSPADID